MKYNNIIQFEPINEVVKFGRTGDIDYRHNLISTFVFSKAYEEALIPLICKNLDYSLGTESFGIQVVGSYGTGKSHLMSLVSLIAEDATLLERVNNGSAKKALGNIAGKYKVIRFELGTDLGLWDVIEYKIEEALKDLGVDFTFSGLEKLQYQERLQKMMGYFEEKYPQHGLMIVIDEMLAYLKGRSEPHKLNTDLQVLQALGQCSDNTKFRIIFGVQELIYHSSEFQFAAQMLSKVKDRYRDITITKEDVSFVVKNRLLRKDEHQKQMIRKHLEPFTSLFANMHSRLEEYVELFPVHPSYFENFQLIKIGKSQREILKNLSQRFANIRNEDIPTAHPGLITYDMYWQDIESNHDLMAIPDVRKIKEIMDTINDKISTNITGARASKQSLARKIASAAAIKILQNDLPRQNGVNAETLVDDLCYTDPIADGREMLIDTVNFIAKLIITATSGQFFDQNMDNGEYHLRIEGGVNYDQQIKDYAALMSASTKDEYYFQFLASVLPIEANPYRSGFKIWEHNIEWKSHKTFRAGYIFMGNPSEKSTTHPRQHFYIYFMPIFDDSKKSRNTERDEVYFIMDKLSDDFKNAITLYGAAMSRMSSADTSQKNIYRQKCEELRKVAMLAFDRSFVESTIVEYCGEQKPMNSYPLLGQGSSKDQIISNIASLIFEEHFEQENPDYPKFKNLALPLTEKNFSKHITVSLNKIANPQEYQDRNAEAILAGLGVWQPGKLDISESIYARNIIAKLTEKGDGQVINRDEILEPFYAEQNLWISTDFKIEAEFEFLVLSALVALGEIEITLPSGKTINATTIAQIKSIDKLDMYQFSHIRRPKAVNLAAIRELFLQLLGKDLSTRLKDDSTYVELLKVAEDYAKRAASAEYEVRGEKISYGITIISDQEAMNFRHRIIAFKGFCDQLRNYNSEAKMKNFRYSLDDVTKILADKEALEQVEERLKMIRSLDDDIRYLGLAKQYIPQGELLTSINRELTRLSEVLVTMDKKRIDSYKQTLKSLRENYAKWYLEQYLQYRISEVDEKSKQQLLASEQKEVCDMLYGSEFLSGSKYGKWKQNIDKLKVVENGLNKNAVLSMPYHDFNPLDYVSVRLVSLSALKDELKTIYLSYDNALRSILEDPTIIKNLSALSDKERELLQDYKDEKIVLGRGNVMELKRLIETLNKGFSRVEITSDALRTLFNRPMTQEDAKRTFEEYINVQCKGKSNVRIIIK